MKIGNFIPQGTIALSATSTSSHVEFTSQASIDAEDAEVFNSGSVTAFIAAGKSAFGAVVAYVPTSEAFGAYPVGPGVTKTFYKGPGANSIAVITSSATATVFVTAGEGN